MPKPPNQPPAEPPGQPPTEPPGGAEGPTSGSRPTEEVPPCEPKKKKGRPENLNRGVPSNVKRGPDGKLRAKKPAEPAARKLSNAVEDVLVAMRHVANNGPEHDTTYQQDHLRLWMLGHPGQFQDRYLAMEAAAKPSQKLVDGCWEAAEWDGSGPCPTCNREPERPLEDPTTDSIIKMIDRLTEDKGVA